MPGTCDAMSPAMRFALVLLLLAHAAHAEVGFLQEGGIGTASASGLLARDGGDLAVRAAIGGRIGHFGGELVMLKADLGHDETGYYSTISVGPMFTVRQKFGEKQLDRPFERWFEIYGRVGPTYTWILGDPGDGPLDGASGLGYAAGGGIRYVYAVICLVADVTIVRTHASAPGEHDPADELHLRDVPGVDVHGSVVTTTFGFGFAF